jgi:6-phosphogluconate dehydrogenase
MDSYLLEITAKVLKTNQIDNVLDVTAMNGTGTWTVRDALATNTPIPIIATAIDARRIYQQKAQRVHLSSKSSTTNHILHHQLDIISLRSVLRTSMMMCYLQGFELIKAKNQQHSWGVSTKDLATIWMNGCIIRSSMLDFFKSTSEEEHMNRVFSKHNDTQAFAYTLNACLSAGIPTPAISACHQYILMMTQAQSPGSLIQLQRNYFGDHVLTFNANLSKI